MDPKTRKLAGPLNFLRYKLEVLDLGLTSNSNSPTGVKARPFISRVRRMTHTHRVILRTKTCF